MARSRKTGDDAFDAAAAAIDALHADAQGDFKDDAPAAGAAPAVPLKPTGRWHVSLPFQPPLVVAAKNEAEAFWKYKIAYGIIATDHQPTVVPTEADAPDMPELAGV